MNSNFLIKSDDSNQQEAIKTINTTDDEFLDPNLFLNTESANDSNGNNSNISLNFSLNPQIVTLPISPIANSNNAVQTFSSNNQYQT